MKEAHNRSYQSQSERPRSPIREWENPNNTQSLSEPGTPTHRPQSWPDPPMRMVGLSTPFLVSNKTTESFQTPSQQKAVATQVVNEATQRMGKLRILVAEDNWINQNVVKKLVARYEKESDVPEGVDLTIASGKFFSFPSGWVGFAACRWLSLLAKVTRARAYSAALKQCYMHEFYIAPVLQRLPASFGS